MTRYDDRLLDLLAWSVGAVVLLLFAARFFAHTADDAYISFRYAENWARGLGPVFNAGEPVEGYSNFSWVAILAFVHLLGPGPPTAAAVLGVACAVALVGLCVRHGPRTSSAWLRAAAPLWVAASPPLAVWASAGLETPFFALLTAALVLEAARDREEDTLGIRCGALGALLSITRPEGLAVAASVGLLWWAAAPERRWGAFRLLTRYGVIVFAAFAPYYLWRLSYYGSWLPHTFHVKVGASGSQLARGLDYVTGYAWPTGLLLLGLAVCGALRGRRPRFQRVVAGFVAVWCAYVIAVGGDGLVMYRFLVPILAPTAILAAAGLDRLAEPWQGRRIRPVVVAALVLATAGSLALDGFRGLALAGVRQEVREVGAWRAIGQWLGREAPPDASVAVLAAGAIPYYSGLEAIDLLGLTDRQIGHGEAALGKGQAGHEKYDTEYVLEQRPDYVVVGNYGLIAPRAPQHVLVQPFYEAEKALVDHPRFRREYRFREVRLPAGRFAVAVRAPAGEDSTRGTESGQDRKDAAGRRPGRR